MSFQVTQHDPEYGDDTWDEEFPTRELAQAAIQDALDNGSDCTFSINQDDEWDILDSDSPLLGGPLGRSHDTED
jgi:hypothetical protein